MTRIVIVKNEQGKLEGFSAEDERAYSKWRRLILNMEVGETLEFDFTIPRSPKHHRKFMHKVRTLLERTEAITEFEGLRKWVVAGAGYLEPDGVGGWQAQSLAFSEMDEADFAELHRRVDDFLWSERATSFLWPHLTEAAQHTSMESFFYAVERREES